MSAPISFLSDYGLADEFVGVCHAVIATICPDAQVIDITHGIPRHDVRAGALILRGALPYLPAGVVLAVVDPDVGAERRAVAIRAGDGRQLVGPDNGLLWLAAELSGGVSEAVDIARSAFRLEPVSATFHGRDIFAPVAARLAAGAGLRDCGEPLDPGRLVRVELPRPRLEDGALMTQAVYVDRFGNVALGVEHDAARRQRPQARPPGVGRARGRHQPRGALRADVRRRGARRAAALRGLQPAAGARDQSRRRRRNPGDRRRRRAEDLARVSPAAPRRRLGSPRVHYRLIDSTNERARLLATARAPHGTLVTAAEQSAGRGRQGRRWTAPAGPGAAVLGGDPRPVAAAAARLRGLGRRDRRRRSSRQVAE